MKQRIAFLDGVKGFGILSIILGHVFIPGWNEFLFLYHLPIFFLLAGYFTNTRRSFGTFAGNRARRLLVPYAVTAALIILFSIPKSLVEHTSVFEGLQHWCGAALCGVGVKSDFLPMESIGAIWFLWALFWASLLLRGLIATKYRAVRLLAVAALFAAGVLTIQRIFLPLSIQPALAALLYLYLGWLFHEFKDRLDREAIKGTRLGSFYDTYKGYALPAVFLLALSLYLEAAFHYKPFLMVRAAFDGGALAVTGSLAGSIVVYIAIWFLYRWKDRAMKPLCAALTWLGQNSLLLLCMHIIEQDLIPWKQYYGDLGLAGTPFYAAVFFPKLAFVLVAGLIISHIPGVKKIFRER